MTGNLTLDGGGFYTNEIIKSTRASGYAVQVKSNDTGDAVSFIHTNGNAEFANTTFNGNVTLSMEGTADDHAVTKGYNDSEITSVDPEGKYLKLSGGSIQVLCHLNAVLKIILNGRLVQMKMTTMQQISTRCMVVRCALGHLLVEKIRM